MVDEEKSSSVDFERFLAENIFSPKALFHCVICEDIVITIPVYDPKLDEWSCKSHYEDDEIKK